MLPRKRVLADPLSPRVAVPESPEVVLPIAGRVAARQARAARARAAAQERPEVMGMSVLRRASVSLKTQKTYLRLLNLFLLFSSTRSLPMTSEEEWDTAVMLMMDVLFLEGHAASAGERLLAAVCWWKPELGRAAGGKMAQSRQSLRGWRRVLPAGGRLPLPYDVVMMIVMWLLERGDRHLAVAVLMMMELYCRPAEPLLVRPVDVIPGAAQRPGQLAHVAVLLHPFELGVPSKNQEFDQSLVLDLPRQRPLAEALLALRAERQGQPRLLEVGALEVRQKLAEAGAALHLSRLGPLHPYRLRHSGASIDFASGSRRLEEIQKRGRWRDARSLRRYEHGGRLNELLHRLPLPVREHAAACASALPAVLCERRCPLRTPW